MKVYVVVQYNYDMARNVGVFSTPEAAEAAAAEITQAAGWDSAWESVEVEEFTVDSPGVVDVSEVK